MTDVQDMHLSDDGTCTHVIVVWNWEWETVQPESMTQFNSDSEHTESDYASEADDVPECDQDTDTNVEERIHTVTFKCIGSTCEKRYQKALEVARDRLQGGFTVQVRLAPEIYNLYDSEAVAFECNLDGEWKKIGYVVREALPDVHAALSGKKITAVQFAWIKWITAWSRSGQGYYAGINISKKGYWGATVVASSSTR